MKEPILKIAVTDAEEEIKNLANKIILILKKWLKINFGKKTAIYIGRFQLSQKGDVITKIFHANRFKKKSYVFLWM